MAERRREALDFLVQFSAKENEIREGLSRVQQNDKEALELLRSKNEALQNLLNRATGLLTSSQRENGQQRLSELIKLVAEKESFFCGTSRKFKFRRDKCKHESSAGAPQSETSTENSERREFVREKSKIDQSNSSSHAFEAQQVKPLNTVNAPENPNCINVSNVTNRCIVFPPQSLKQKDCSLTEIRNCSIFILEPLDALRCVNIENSQIWAICVRSSSLLYSSKNCLFVLATKQLRLHDSSNILLSLHCVSNPVIERTSSAAFGPFCVDFENRCSLWKENDLCLSQPTTAHSLSSNKSCCDNEFWSRVLDFNWHKRTPSPNWRVATLTELPLTPYTFRLNYNNCGGNPKSGDSIASCSATQLIDISTVKYDERIVNDNEAAAKQDTATGMMSTNLIRCNGGGRQLITDQRECDEVGEVEEVAKQEVRCRFIQMATAVGWRPHNEKSGQTQASNE